jgi:hypothetical protein
MIMAEGRFCHRIDCDRSSWLYLADACRRPQVIADTISPAEAGGGDDFFVVDAFAAEAGFVAVGDVSFAGNGAEFQIGGHRPPPGIVRYLLNVRIQDAAEGSRP